MNEFELLTFDLVLSSLPMSVVVFSSLATSGLSRVGTMSVAIEDKLVVCGSLGNVEFSAPVKFAVVVPNEVAISVDAVVLSFVDFLGIVGGSIGNSIKNNGTKIINLLMAQCCQYSTLSSRGLCLKYLAKVSERCLRYLSLLLLGI